MWLVSFFFKTDEPGTWDETDMTEAEIEARKMPRFGAILQDAGEDGSPMIVDLTAALPAKWQPLDAIAFLRKGDDAFRRADETIRRGEFRVPIDDVRLLAPVTNPGVVLNVADNYVERDWKEYFREQKAARRALKVKKSDHHPMQTPEYLSCCLPMLLSKRDLVSSSASLVMVPLFIHARFAAFCCSGSRGRSRGCDSRGIWEFSAQREQ